MISTNSKVIIGLVAATLLSSCGSGSETTKNETVDISDEVDINEEVDVEEVNISTAELYTDAGFELNSTTALDIRIDISDLKNERAYLNICRADEDGSADYNNCMLNAPIKNGQLNTQLILGNEIDILSMEIWRYDINSAPFRYQWDREDGAQWDVL